MPNKNMEIFVVALQHPRVFVAQHGGQILGIVVIEPRAKGVADVTEVLVGDRRRQGIATRLMSAAVTH